MRTPPVLRSHLTCAPLLVTGVTGVNAIKDSPAMALTAQVSYFIDPSSSDFTVTRTPIVGVARILVVINRGGPLFNAIIRGEP